MIKDTLKILVTFSNSKTEPVYIKLKDDNILKPQVFKKICKIRNLIQEESNRKFQRDEEGNSSKHQKKHMLEAVYRDLQKNWFFRTFYKRAWYDVIIATRAV